jgi:hypothetical protein
MFKKKRKIDAKKISIWVLVDRAFPKFQTKFMTFGHICEGWSDFCIRTVMVECQLMVNIQPMTGLLPETSMTSPFKNS